ncbi:MAG: hypothetical protein MIO93_10230 [ANME-2 cluster archaeon]|nr:hypothetical protein [ANME-2 cluster archaeon]
MLPPPNYMVQFNSWLINVEGRIDGFTLADADNEVHPNPMFGHEAQVYKRTREPVYDPIDFMPVGYNTPLDFSFTTGTFIIVPPNKIIGDKEGGMVEDSEKYGEILSN